MKQLVKKESKESMIDLVRDPTDAQRISRTLCKVCKTSTPSTRRYEPLVTAWLAHLEGWISPGFPGDGIEHIAIRKNLR